MLKWINGLSDIQYAFLVGCGGAMGALIGVWLINSIDWLEPMPYWLALAGFSGGFYGGLKIAKREEKL